MSVGLKHPQSLVKIKGIRLSASSAKIYRKKRDDIALIEITDGSVTSAAFTQNRFCAAPVQISKNHLSKSKPRYCLINAGNANAGTGEALNGAEPNQMDVIFLVQIIYSGQAGRQTKF